MIKKLINKIKNNRKVLFVSFTFLLLLVVTIFSFTLSAIIEENDFQVSPQSELTYYIDVSYDGIDKDKVVSSDTQTSNVFSGIINVEDKLPEGLTFKEFVTTGNSSIGAVYRNDRDRSCPGYVFDDGVNNSNNYHGLHYDPETRTVSFQVKNLQAGCVLTIGIKTTTPAIDDPLTPETEVRRDFYNYATATEEDLSVHSNTVHVWMGSDSTDMYDVTYSYDSDVPPNAPVLPTKVSYAAGTSVGVASEPALEGYTFSGWTTTDVEISDSKFTMPTHNVKFVGHFTEQTSYQVTYKINGDTPDEYVVPSSKNYFASQNVKIDSLAAGTVFNGYRFKGWNIEDSDITVTEDNDFIMPEHDVTIVGEFELVTYKVEYQFTGAIIPPNPENYLPATKSYRPGATVKLENVTSEPAGYQFLGWYEDDTFTMPEEDVIVYGEWKELAGTFSPTITKEIVNKKDFYRIGDTVTYTIKVTNTASFPIRDVIIKENNDKATFVSGTGYEISSAHIVNIANLAANTTITITATYKVTEEDIGTITNTVKIMGALPDKAHPKYELAPDGDYEASAEFNAYQSKLKICKQVDNINTDKVFIFKITSNTGYEQDIRLQKDECQTIIVDPGKYQVLEVIPQEYELKRLEGGIISSNGEEFTIGNNGNYEITFVNTFKRKGFFHSAGEVVNRIIRSLIKD